MKSRTRRMLERRRRRRRVKLRLYGNRHGVPIISPIVVTNYIRGAWDAVRQENPFLRQLARQLLLRNL